MAKTNFAVARIVTHTRSDVGKCERHNERKNEHYGNRNVDLSRTPENVHFKDCGELTYNEMLDKLVSDGTVSLRGLKADTKVYDEMILDVNTDYFERHGGYGFAVQFYREAYRFAVDVYGEGNILSAVLHADEVNLGLSDRYGYPVYHYHLHVVALPVIEKEIRWSKRCKDKSLAGTVKEIVWQVSHSKKWKSQKVTDEDGGVRLVPSYRILQDAFCQHMQDAGYTGLVRGERGSDAQHLSCLEYQIRQDTKRLQEIQEAVKEEAHRCEAAAAVNKTAQEIDSMGKKTLTGKVSVSKTEYGTLTQLAKEGAVSRGEIYRLKKDNATLRAEVVYLRDRVRQLEKQLQAVKEFCRPYWEATKAAPEKVKAFLDDILEPLRRQREEQRRSILYTRNKSRTRPRRKEERER